MKHNISGNRRLKAVCYNIAGRYPVRANWLVFEKGINGKYTIKNGLTNKCFEVTYRVVRFLYYLDGNTNPYNLVRFGYSEEEITSIMEFLERNNLLRNSGRTLISEPGVILRTLFIPKRKSSRSIIPKVYNFLLLLSCIPIFALGIYRLGFIDFLSMDGRYIFIGIVVGIVAGILLHEVSHAMSCLAYGGELFEAGIMWQYIMPGAYVLINSRDVSRMRRVQINAAGVEMNILLGGALLASGSYVNLFSEGLYFAGISNLTLAILNMLFIEGLDGFHIIGELLGINDFDENAKDIATMPGWFMQRVEGGLNGAAIVAVCAVVRIFQVMMFVIVIDNICAIVGGFV